MAAKIVVATVSSILTAAVAILMVNLTVGDKTIDRQVETLYTVGDPQFVRTMGVMLGPSLVAGNDVVALANGDQIFPAMVGEIKRATKTITFESYIYWSGRVGKQFADALAERARAGVRVHVLIDWLGSEKISDALIDEMKNAGVEIERYHPPHWYKFGRFNNRTHRKILVVDGKVGFTGGVGIADLWSGDAQDKDHWRDTQFRVEGPAVAEMQAAFHDNWSEVTGKVLHGPDYFPPLTAAGNRSAQMFFSAPGGGGESMQLMYLLSIAAAAKNIRISASYFVPDEVTVASLVAALKRGVRVQIIVPGPIIDSKLVQRASEGRWGPILEAGGEIYEYQPTMFHVKEMVVDEVWTSVGSTNFDNRSFAINDEANLNVYDKQFALEQIAIFNRDLLKSRQVSIEEWKSRPWTEKLAEHFANSVGEQL